MKKKTKRQKGKPLASKYLPDVQLKKLLKFVKNRADLARERGATRAIIDELIVLLLTNTGLRPKEFCDLRIRDLTLRSDRNTLCVRDAAGKAVRHIDISSTTVDHLQKFIRLYRKDATPDDPLVVSERNGHFTYMSLYSKVKNIGEKAGIGRLHPHMLRRTYLVNLYNAKRDLRFVQEQAGYANLKTAAIYAGATSSHRQEIEEIDDADLGVAKPKNDLHESSKRFLKCEGCGDSFPQEKCMKIGSGQIICNDCLGYFRSE